MSHYQIPGKTFLIGEYAVLQGAPALLFTTSPCFEFEVKDFNVSKINLESLRIDYASVFQVFHPLSPAGKWVTKNKDVFENVFVKFNDPYSGRGGFGASTAQFLSVWKYSQSLVKNSATRTEKVNQLLKDYWECSWTGEGTRPSGADLVAQYSGGISEFLAESSQVESFMWPWPQIEVYLISTGFKVQTHDHLKGLSLSELDSDLLKKQAQQSLENFKEKNLKLWLEDINNYAEQLERMNLVSAESLRLQKRMKQSSLFYAVKGCGALGADVILAVADKNPNSDEKVRTLLNELNLPFFMTTKNLAVICEN